MTQYTRDGGVIPSSVPVSAKREDEHTKLFGLYRGVIVRPIYPDEPESKTKDRIEYVVKINGQEYPNAVDARTGGGGVYNYSKRVRKGVEKSFSGKKDKSTYDQNVDGEAVYVLFLRGHGDIPIILASDQHPKHSKYKKSKKSDGLFDVNEFNGLEVKVDKDSNFTIKQLGRKSPEGVIENEDAVGAMFKMSGKDGSIFMKNSDGKGVFNVEKNGSIKVISDGTYVSLDATDGTVIVANKDGHVISMSGDNMTFTHKDGDTIIDMSSDTVQITTKKLISNSEKTSIETGDFALGAAGIEEKATMKGVWDGGLETELKATTSLKIGSSSAAESLVLGDTLKSYLSALESEIDLITADLTMLTTHFTTLATALLSDSVTPLFPAVLPATLVVAPTLPPLLAAVTASIAANQVARAVNKAIYIDVPATNILSLKCKTERI